MSPRLASKRLVALEESAMVLLKQAEKDAFGLLSDAELERLADAQDDSMDELDVAWQEIMSLSPERQSKSRKLLFLHYLREFSRAINQR